MDISASLSLLSRISHFMENASKTGIAAEIVLLVYQTTTIPGAGYVT